MLPDWRLELVLCFKLQDQVIAFVRKRRWLLLGSRHSWKLYELSCTEMVLLYPGGDWLCWIKLLLSWHSRKNFLHWLWEEIQQPIYSISAFLNISKGSKEVSLILELKQMEISSHVSFRQRFAAKAMPALRTGIFGHTLQRIFWKSVNDVQEWVLNLRCPMFNYILVMKIANVLQTGIGIITMFSTPAKQ